MGSEQVIEVRAGYRLHLGFYRFYDNPYIYGSLGVSVEEPHISVLVRSSPILKVRCDTKLCEELVVATARLLNIRDVEVEVSGYLSHHVGLGSRTRILLTTYLALTNYLGVEADVGRVINLLGGRKISGVGIYSFFYGNLVVDSGLNVNDASMHYPKLLYLYEVPGNWYLIIVLPEGFKGLSEVEEVSIIRNVEAFPKQELLYKEFVRLLTSLSLRDFNIFTNALSRIQELTGEYFSKYQGGVFAHDISEELATVMRSEGVRGIGQSSWGPTIYGFTDSYAKALSVRSSILSYAERKGLSVKCWVTNIASLGHQVFIHRPTA
ncbi:MAG: hypothetical protein QXD36_05235 [Sulfolobales archaeon]